MINFRDTVVCLAIILFVLADKLMANYPLKGNCPFAQLQQHYQDSFQDDSVMSSASVAFADLRNSNAQKLLQIYDIMPTSVAGFSNNLNRGPNGAPQSYINHGNKYLESYLISKETEKLSCAIPPLNCANDTTNNYYRSFDGSCNNLQYPGYGMANSRYSRLLTPRYSDGVYLPTASVTGASLPNARLLSLSLYGDATMPDSFRTMAFLHWGQLVAHDISQITTKGAPEDCCAIVHRHNKQCYPIELHSNGPISSGSGKTCMSFARTSTDADATCPNSGLPYTEKISLATAYLDLSSIYGNSLDQSNKVRQYTGGLLKTSWTNNRHWIPVSTNNGGDCAENQYQCYSIPDNRNQFIPNIAIMHTIMLREHNRIANALVELNPNYSDERIFQEARKINIAQFQKITYYDWLPLIIGRSYAYANYLIHYARYDDYVNDYDVAANSAPYAEFSAAAFRYAHNQIPGWFSMVNPTRFYNQTMRLSDYFERPENLNLLSDGDNFDSLVRGLVTQLQKRPDSNIDKEIKHYFDRKPFEEFGSDLKAIDIQRGRDYGLPSYNDFRQYCGLPRVYDWAGFSAEIPTDKLYASPDDVELSIGGSLEYHAPESILGPTFQCIIGKQFLKTRTGDRFFFENHNLFSGFTRAQLAEIRKASISGLFCSNADHLQHIQPNSFAFPNSRNHLKSCNTIPQLDLSKWKEVQQQTTY